MCNSLLGSANSTLDCHYTGIDAGLNPENNTLPFKTVTSDSSIATLLEQDTTKNITSTLHDSASSNTSKNLPVISNDLGQTILPNISRRGLDVVLNTSHISPNMSDIRPYFSYNRTIITPDDSPSTMHIPVSALIAIVGSALLCISFDVSMAPTRAFILETVPSWQHPNILRTSTVASSLAGVCLSAMGLFNVPHMFGAILHADKTAAALIFLFIFIGVLAVLSFTLTLCTGFKLLSANGNMIQLDAKNQSVKSAERSTVEKNRDSLCCCFGCRKAKGVHKYEKLSTEDLHWNDKDDSDVEIAPEFTACTLENECDEKSIQKSSLGFISPQCVQNHLVGNGEQPREVPHEAGEIGGEHVPSSICDTREWGEPDSENHQCPWQRDNKEIEVCNVTEPTHLLTNSYLGANCDNHPQTLGYGKEKSLSLPEIPPKNHANSNLTLDTSGIPAGPNFCNRRLVIFLAASFFSFGNLLVFLTFASNSLTIAVYKGDPKAPQGSEARGNYERGLRMCSVGVFAYYVAYFIMSSCNKKVLDIVGPHVLFIVANLLMGVACLVFVYTSHLAAYFWAMLSCSLHKSMSYTVPFLLATQYSLQDQIQDDDNSKTDTGQTQKLGRVTSMIGFLFPAQSLFVCSVMGPVMDIAETAWPPMYYCFVAGCLASLIMSFLLFMK
ncbi:uncharacterized protein LOC106011875 [Aplysia californica]|uniref:Uncharacterized protein LOC106011875 n=1 Tax=Aplysia californica TaxID=6500 RepID=A0ABM1A0Q2_APLCA|nr:uncharacterized protein LOC106011875 [Aplysia californica]